MKVAPRVFDIGDQPVTTGTFTNAAGVPTAPTAVTVIVRKPDGTETPYTTPNAAISLGATTTFTFPAALDQAGEWVVRMKATGGLITAGEDTFIVRPSKVTNP